MSHTPTKPSLSCPPWFYTVVFIIHTGYIQTIIHLQVSVFFQYSKHISEIYIISGGFWYPKIWTLTCKLKTGTLVTPTLSSNHTNFGFSLFFFFFQVTSSQGTHGHSRQTFVFGSGGFSVAAPTIWNSLPLDIRNCCSIASFRRQLKTFLFSTSGHL